MSIFRYWGDEGAEDGLIIRIDEGIADDMVHERKIDDILAEMEEEIRPFVEKAQKVVNEYAKANGFEIPKEE